MTDDELVDAVEDVRRLVVALHFAAQDAQEAAESLRWRRLLARGTDAAADLYDLLVALQYCDQKPSTST
mgnify:CR=1 FL=1